MITYDKHTLRNGLTVIANRDRSSRMAAVNLLYKVGARNEQPFRTGLAHLFEHLIFRGTHLVPDFDTPVQMACGENNAFTNNDYTDFYITLPVANIETALWLESDRMTGLNLSSEAIEIEKRVVIEEFRQRYLNQPYGDQNMLLRDMVYTTHPYRWATIGLTPDHIEQATEEEIRDIARFADSLPNVTELHLLPYHRLGQDKYTGLGRRYEMDGIAPPTDALMHELLAAAQSVSTKLAVQIGG